MRIDRNCQNCGKIFTTQECWIKKTTRKNGGAYCSIKCKDVAQAGPSVVYHDAGYRMIRMKGHHLANNYHFAYEHRVMAEKKLGRRLLPKEIVHHKNGNKLDNRPENLEVTTQSAHARHHAPETILKNPWRGSKKDPITGRFLKTGGKNGDSDIGRDTV